MVYANPFARIVVGYDDSPAADIALERALELAHDYLGDVVVVCITDVPVASILHLQTAAQPQPYDVAPLRDSLDGPRARLFANVSARVATSHVPVRLEFSMNDKAAGILDAAKRWNATAIAVGTHARNGVSHAMIGSVAEGVVRGSRVPVIVVRENMSATAFARIVVGIDSSELPTSASAMALALARDHSVRLVYCSVFDTASVVRPIADMPFDSTSLIAGLREAAHDVLDFATQNANANDVYPVTEVTNAVDAATGIVDVARRLHADAIIVGHQKRGDLERYFIGSTAEAVMRSSDVSVIVVPNGVMPTPGLSASHSNADAFRARHLT